MFKDSRIVVLLVIVFLLAGCGLFGNENGKVEEPEETQPGMEEENQQTPSSDADDFNLNLFLFSDVGLTKHFHGYAEYGHNETLQEITEAEDGMVYKFTGTMTDGRGLTDEEGNPLSFEKIVTVTDELIKTEINSDYLELVMTSIFPEKIILKKPLELHHSWTEQVNIDGESYEAISTIVAMDEEKGSRYIEVETMIEDIAGFPNQQYKERIQLEEQKGLVFFENTMKHLTDPLSDDGYTFGYGLSVIQ